MLHLFVVFFCQMTPRVFVGVLWFGSQHENTDLQKSQNADGFSPNYCHEYHKITNLSRVWPLSRLIVNFNMWKENNVTCKLDICTNDLALKPSGVTHVYIFTCDWCRGLGPPNVENFPTYSLQPPGSRLYCDFKDVVLNILQKSQFYIRVEMPTRELQSSVCYWNLLLSTAESKLL